MFLAITGFIGKTAPQPPPPDSDGDGVSDLQDRCLRTPAGRTVNAVGCQVDVDGDSVLDFDDRCPNTPAGAPVDASRSNVRGARSGCCPLPVVPSMAGDCEVANKKVELLELGGCMRVWFSIVATRCSTIWRAVCVCGYEDEYSDQCRMRCGQFSPHINCWRS